MKKTFLILVAFASIFSSFAQNKIEADSSWKNNPRYTPKRINNLVHTKLDVKLDYEHSWLTGKAWITLTPHLYPTDSLTLDAKGMDILQVALVNKDKTQSPLVYQYNKKQLQIKLPKQYKKGEQYSIYINYVSKPNEYEKEIGGDPMLGVKGLYFINPTGENKKKPIQVWTQGETESNSVWFPTIDQTQQKTTQELTLTVPSKYVTLSNGKLVSQKINTDGTRTDYWKMDLPHSPYLFFMGVGDYAVIKDSWRGKEVNYYVEKEFGPVAKKIFGNTPEMMTYFSKISGIDYPWVKYSQMTGREFVAGAMENTTATLHQEGAQQDARELTDQNSWEGTIAHELFHQWFGDYATAESWSNLTVNESFADYSQTLWDEYKYGKDAGDAENYSGLQAYLMGNNSKKDLVRFYYADKEEMFDAVSYQKGGRILHMLRKYIGDSAFFKGINLYLSTNKFKSAEAHHLRLALEEVSGQDLNWYFNQWYFGSGHPKLDVQYKYNDTLKEAMVIVKQTQATGKIFRIPTYIDIYNGKTKTRHQVWAENTIDTFRFVSLSKPDLINFDAEKILICEKKENKSLENYVYQYRNAGNYVDRREAVEFCGRKTDNAEAITLLKEALSDPYHVIRELAISKLDMKKEKIRAAIEPVIAQLVKTEKNRPVKSSMISALATTKSMAYKQLYESNIKDSSYSVAGASLEALSKIDSLLALKYATELSNDPAKGKLDIAINKILVASGNEEVFNKMENKFLEMELSNEKFTLMQQIADMIGSMKDSIKIKRGIALITGFRDQIPENFKEQITPYINGMILQGLITKFKAAGNEEIVEFIEANIKK
jgi:aminopeptidase N